MKCTLIDLDVLRESSSRSFRKCPFGPVIPRGCLFGYFSRLHPTPDTGSSHWSFITSYDCQFIAHAIVQRAEIQVHQMGRPCRSISMIEDCRLARNSRSINNRVRRWLEDDQQGRNFAPRRAFFIAKCHSQRKYWGVNHENSSDFGHFIFTPWG